MIAVLRFLLRRTGQMLLVLFCFITLTYFVLQAMPGDFTSIYAGNAQITPEVLASLQVRFGLDQPVGVQYWRFLRNVLTGSLGVSFSQYPTPVWTIIKQSLPRTCVLFYSATVLSFICGFSLGKSMAWRRGSRFDTAMTAVGITLYTAFYPLVAFICIWLFAFQLRWVPLNGFIEPALWREAPVTSHQVLAGMLYTALVVLGLIGATYLWERRRCGAQRMFGRSTIGVAAVAVALAVALWSVYGYIRYAWDIAYHLLTPVLVLALVSFGGNMLLTRDAMLETLGEDYITAARARGIPERAVRDRYAARNSLLPVVTSLTLSLGSAIGGGVVTETLFSWPGLGRTLLQASLSADLPLAIGAFLFTGVFLMVAHLVADIVNVALDPRLRSDKRL